MSSLELTPSVIYEAMGYGSTLPDVETRSLTSELLQQAITVAKPSFYYTIESCKVQENAVQLATIRLETGKTIATLLRKSECVALFVATAGKAFQQWLDNVSSSGDALRMFVLDAIGSAIVEAVGDYMETVLQAEIGEKLHTNRFSPGYCGWDIREQHKLFSLLPTGVCHITLSESALMHPIKSISGIVGVGDEVSTRKYGCAICNNKNCYLRKK